MVIRERGGRTITKTFRSEDASQTFIMSRVAKGTTIHADESAAYDALHARYPMKRINHQEAYSLDGACTNGAEGYFSRLRRAEIGIYHHIGGAYVDRYAQEAAFREDQSWPGLFGQESTLDKWILCRLSSHSVDFSASCREGVARPE